MATGRHIAVLLILLGLVSESISRPIIQTTPENPKSDQISDGVRVRSDSNSSYCESWRYSIETNDAGYWSLVPARCEDYVKEYMTGGRFLSDLEVVADDALAFAKTVNVSGDGKDAWVFDIDDTLLSSLPYYATIGYG
ncbi:hypothetical protein Vadar_014271 [Vaccinium darrowii]|uniref:Uncharacterized protein n=1 Tax=Vaccinium darrowii TaxID=229202 RepID=A0ACB7YE19_9ERIC|nr:hypothetical protein Vadar_014271 [Vaccinium darrowii]